MFADAGDSDKELNDDDSIASSCLQWTDLLPILDRYLSKDMDFVHSMETLYDWDLNKTKEPCCLDTFLKTVKDYL